MELDLAQKAVNAALSGNWKEAVKLNRDILKKDPKDTQALNRMARAYAELGNFVRAKNLSKKVVKLDPFNSIAQKALKKYGRGQSGKGFLPTTASAEAFLEEPGKTKLISLLYLGGPSLILKLDCGDEVKFSIGAHRLSVITLDGKYIGRLSDDLSARLRRFMKQGNVYNVLIKSADPEEVRVFIREIKRVEVLSDTPSFPPEKVEYVSFTPPELVSKKEDLVLDINEEEN